MKKAFLQSVCACINFWWRALLVDGSRSSFFFNAQYQIGKNMQIQLCGKKITQVKNTKMTQMNVIVQQMAERA
jgi:hypothetical protein